MSSVAGCGWVGRRRRPTAAVVREADATTLGLPATAFTMEKEFYRDVLAARGLRVLIPRRGGASGDYEEFVLGKLEESSRGMHRRVIADLVNWSSSSHLRYVRRPYASSLQRVLRWSPMAARIELTSSPPAR